MATSINSDPLTKFKCHICGVIPSEAEINQCAQGHVLCLKCVSLNGRRCKCTSVNLVKLPNPMLRIVSKTKFECPYKDDGCEWVVSEAKNMADHSAECKYRPYPCVGTQLGVWSCGWIGAQHDFFAHMKSKHGENGAFFTHWHNGRIEFDSAKNCTKFNLIDAFNRKFVFLYMSHARNANLFFLIYLLGRKSDAQKFMIDFELRNDMRKIKFIETCYSDAGNIAELIKDHNCFILPKKLVESYAVNGSLEFRFVIKRKDDIKLENAEKQQFLKANVFHASSQSLANVTTAKPSIKVYQSETNLVMAAQPSNRSNGSAKGKSRYRRQPKN